MGMEVSGDKEWGYWEKNEQNTEGLGECLLFCELQKSSRGNESGGRGKSDARRGARKSKCGGAKVSPKSPC